MHAAQGGLGTLASRGVLKVTTKVTTKVHEREARAPCAVAQIAPGCDVEGSDCCSPCVLQVSRSSAHRAGSPPMSMYEGREGPGSKTLTSCRGCITPQPVRSARRGSAVQAERPNCDAGKCSTAHVARAGRLHSGACVRSHASPGAWTGSMLSLQGASIRACPSLSRQEVTQQSEDAWVALRLPHRVPHLQVPNTRTAESDAPPGSPSGWACRSPGT